MNDILGRLTPGRHVVSLQGEGEPTMHPRFWDWAERLRKTGYIPYTITNGSRIDAEQANRLLPSLGISLDTVDEIEANRIGRLKLDCVLRNVDVLLKSMGPQRLIIHTVNYGQPLDSLLDYLRAHRLTRHIIQSIQPKSDYARRYQDHPVVKPPVKHAAGTCRYLSRPLMRYFDVNGKELPCCYIKDAREFPGVDVLRQLMSRGDVPNVCDGCSEIPERQPMNRAVFY